MDGFFTFLDEENLEGRIREIDGSLELEEVIDRGSYGIVAKVSRGDEVYALKLGMFYDDEVSIDREYRIQQRLSGIYGIPEVLETYGNAYLMQYIDGKKLYNSGIQSSDFFANLREIVEQMNEQGVSLQDDAEINILVDSNGDPWIIDFAFARTSEEIDDVVSYSKDILNKIEEKFS